MKYNPLAQLMASHTIEAESHCEYYAIGDVHGCNDEYLELIAECENDARLQSKYARFIQLGDMIDRGPHFIDMILNDPSHFRTIGNHEYNFVLEHYGYKQCISNARNLNHARLKELPHSEQEDVIDLLMKRETFVVIRIEGRLIVLSHAPIKDIEKGVQFIHNDSISSVPNYCMRSTDLDLEQLRSSNHSGTTFVYGHQSWNYKDIDEQVQEQLGFDVTAYNIDAGCVYGGDLIALRLRDNRSIKVKSKIKVDKH